MQIGMRTFEGAFFIISLFGPFDLVGLSLYAKASKARPRVYLCEEESCHDQWFHM